MPPEVLDFSHAPPVPERVRLTRVCELHASSTCKAYIGTKPNPLPALAPVDCAMSALLTVDKKFDQVHSNLFLRLDSMFDVCFSIRNLDMTGDENSRPIHIIFCGDNFAQWSKAMRNYLKGCKL